MNWRFEMSTSTVEGSLNSIAYDDLSTDIMSISGRVHLRSRLESLVLPSVRSAIVSITSTEYHKRSYVFQWARTFHIRELLYRSLYHHAEICATDSLYKDRNRMMARVNSSSMIFYLPIHCFRVPNTTILQIDTLPIIDSS